MRAVVLYGPIGVFASVRAAARKVGSTARRVRIAANTGGMVKGYFAGYAEQPTLQVNHDKKGMPVVWQGKLYPSIRAAAGGNEALRVRINRAIKRQKQT